MSGSSAEAWLRFFTAAGLPKESAETYAVTFAKNHMKLDMLPEIKKDYLVDMGISLIGHIIAILRHAKTVHEEAETRATLSRAPGAGVQVPPAMEPKLTKVVLEPKGSPSINIPVATRMLGHYMSEREKGGGGGGGELPTATKRVVSSGGGGGGDVPPTLKKKVRRVAPEQEGGYTIKMPSGTTPRSRQILSKVQGGATEEKLEKKPVFERLGFESCVSSSTEPEPEQPPSNSQQKKVSSRLGAKVGEQRPSNRLVISTAHSQQEEEEGVFSRLGSKCVVSSTVPVSERRSGPQGILKQRKSMAPASTPAPSGRFTMVADKPCLPAKVRTQPSPALPSPKLIQFTIKNGERGAINKGNIKDRLGLQKSTEVAESTNNQERRGVGNNKKVSFGAVSRASGAKPEGRSLDEDEDEDDRYRGSIGLGTGIFSRLGLS